MRIFQSNKNNIPYLVIRYEPKEWLKIESVLTERLNLICSEAKDVFGISKAMVYLQHSNNLKNLLLETIRQRYNSYTLQNFNSNLTELTDSINKPFIYANNFNIAFLRIRPIDNEIKIELDGYLTFIQLKQFANLIKTFYETLFDIATNCEIELKFNEIPIKQRLKEDN
jgi:hypothetical protein